MVMIQALNKKHGTRVTHLDSGVLELFQAYHWPGNARELRNVIERAVIVAAAGTVSPTGRPASGRPTGAQGNGGAKPTPSGTALNVQRNFE